MSGLCRTLTVKSFIAPRPGRLEVLSRRDERTILHALRKNRRADSSDQCPRVSLDSLLRQHNINKWLAKKRPQLAKGGTRDSCARIRIGTAEVFRVWSRSLLDSRDGVFATSGKPGQPPRRPRKGREALPLAGRRYIYLYPFFCLFITRMRPSYITTRYTLSGLPIRSPHESGTCKLPVALRPGLSQEDIYV